MTQTYVTDDNGLVNVDTKNTAGGDWFLLRGNSRLLPWRLRPVFQAEQSYRPVELFRLEKISRIKQAVSRCDLGCDLILKYGCGGEMCKMESSVTEE